MFALDEPNNEPVRPTVIAFHGVVEFAIEAGGQKIGPKLAREMRRRMVRVIGNILDRLYPIVTTPIARCIFYRAPVSDA